MDPVNFLLRSGSSARDLNIGEFFFSDFYLLSVSQRVTDISKRRIDFIITCKIFLTIRIERLV